MIRLKPSSIFIFLLLSISLVVGISLSSETSKFTTDTLKNIKWRQIGPASFGGRIDDVEAVSNNPNIIFVAAASGGIFKSEDHAATWKAVFDEEGTALSIGDIAIAPSDPDIVWAGTGEPNNRQSSSWGDGVYKSIDGGNTWEFMGLKETHHIGRIMINPSNPDDVYVAALGHLWGANPERGVYRTKDGGKTWEKCLYINEDTGIVDVVLEKNGRILYAASYQRRRRGWGFIGGGPHSGIYRSLNGGDTWEKLTKGLPEGDLGRIGLAISRSHSNIVYAAVQTKTPGIFRSEDRGSTWTRMGPQPEREHFLVYFSKIRVDPLNPDKIWHLNHGVFLSLDGGKTFTGEGTWENVHTDHHALWINPETPDHLLLGGDGGLYISHNGAKTWDLINNLPLAQFYAIGIDTRDPYWIYGGAQDHGAFGIPSRTDSSLGIRNSHVERVSYGDGFYCVVDPRDHNLIYTENQQGRLLFINMKTNEERLIRPIPDDSEELYRFNWKSPLVMSPHNPDIIYYGGNKIFKTSDQGHTWEEISPDLSNNQDWKKLLIMGIKRKEDTIGLNYGVAYYGTVTTISESPVQADLIYAGTDDGNVQMTKDGGKTWKNLTKNFRLPQSLCVSHILTSSHSSETAFTCFTGHPDDDFTPYIFKTTDLGKTWKDISGDMPEGMVVNTLAEHPRNPELLFAGTEFGLFISVNGGENWILARGNLPRVPVDDIIVNARANDLILGTHGRGIFILDDIALLEHLKQTVLDSEAYLFPLRVATQYFETREMPYYGKADFSGPNPDYGALITYYLKTGAPSSEDFPDKKPRVKIVVLDKEGKIVRELEGPGKEGMNRVSWDLRYPLGFNLEGSGGGYYELRGPAVHPGEYVVKLMANGKEIIQEVKVRIDPRIDARPEDLEERFRASQAMNEIARAFLDTREATQKMQNELNLLKTEVKNKGEIPEMIKATIDEIQSKLDEIFDDFRKELYGMQSSIMDLLGQIEASTSTPSEAQLKAIERMRSRLERDVKITNILLTEKFPKLQSELDSKGIRPFIAEPVKPPKRY